MDKSTELFKNEITEKLIIARLEHDEGRPLSPEIERRTVQRLEKVEAQLDVINSVCLQILLAGCRESERRAG